MDSVVGIMSATPEAGLDLAETAWIEGTVCYRRRSRSISSQLLLGAILSSNRKT